jgi:hypothetical protein
VYLNIGPSIARAAQAEACVGICMSILAVITRMDIASSDLNVVRYLRPTPGGWLHIQWQLLRHGWRHYVRLKSAAGQVVGRIVKLR